MHVGLHTYICISICIHIYVYIDVYARWASSSTRILYIHHRTYRDRHDSYIDVYARWASTHIKLTRRG